ncbi:MAG: type II toxin-antitoxin system VapC family toxin [Candidatus Rokuibacteriota bacterium]
MRALTLGVTRGGAREQAGKGRDTHVWVWTQEQPERLGSHTRRLLVDAAHENWVCPISTVEIARLVAVGAIRLSIPLGEWIAQSMTELAAQTVSVSHDVAIDASALPGTFHRDPADRLLVAATRRNGLTLVTADDRILAYPHVRTQDARR